MNVEPPAKEAPSPRGLRLSMPMVTTLILAVGILVALLLPDSREFLVHAGSLLMEGNALGLKEHLGQLGWWAAVVSSALMILQALAAPIPAVPITLANGLLFGPWLGALISWAAAQVAALICFQLSRGLGRPFVTKLVKASTIEKSDAFFQRHGLPAVATLRLLPFISFDAVSYAAGLTKMRALPFFIATGIGQAPACIVYSHVGFEMAEHPTAAMRWLLIFLSAVAVIVLIWRVRTSKRAKRARDAQGSASAMGDGSKR